FFFQAEDGIRDFHVTGVQTCALPISGSVGVVMAHASYEDYLEQEGIKVTLIHSGAHKTDGNPYEDLPGEVLERFQADTDTLRHRSEERRVGKEWRSRWMRDK